MSTSAERMRALRERRAAELEAVPAAAGDAGPSLADAVAESVAALGLGDQDAACVALAGRVALAIDASPSAAVLRALGPLMRALLGELGATPAARARGGKGKPERPAAPSGVARLRAAHARDRARFDRPRPGA